MYVVKLSSVDEYLIGREPEHMDATRLLNEATVFRTITDATVALIKLRRAVGGPDVFPNAKVVKKEF